MKNPNQNVFLGLLITLFAATSIQLHAQNKVDIWELMNRKDLRLKDIDEIAQKHFKEVGKVKGTGYKQYERWKYEMQFHLDNNGYLRAADYDAKQYTQSKGDISAAAVPGAWTELGPFSWNRTSGWNPGVGRVTSISVYPLDNNIIYVTSPGGGVWKSVSGGNAWTPLNDYNNAMMILYSVAVDPVNSSIVFSGGQSGTLYRSLDGGATWTNQNYGMGTIRKILFNPNNTQIIYASGTGGIYKSTNGGNTWAQVLSVSIEDIEFQPGNTNNLYASGSNIYRSTDAGVSWTQLTATNGITTSARTLISVSPANPQIVYAVQSNGGSEFGRLYRSTDGGNSFITTITGSASTCTNFFGYATNGCETGGQASYDMAMTVNPTNANEVHIAGIICWKSTNGGSSFVAETAWSLPNSTGYNHADVHVLEWVGNSIYSGSDGGIYKSTDNGDNWTDLSNGLGVRQFYRIANAKTNQVFVTGGAQDNGSSILKSTGWIDWLGADGMDCVVSPLNADYIWGTSQYGSLYRTTNGGTSYSGISEPATGNWVTPLAIESNSNIIYAGWNDVYKSIDLGATWTNLSGATISSNLEELAVAPSNPLYIYASTGSSLYVTKNGGSSWSTYVLSGISITSIAIHPTNPEKIWVSSANATNRVLVSTDAGATFTNISGNLPVSAARSIVVDQTSDEGLYVGMNIGVYYINKNMSTWIDLTENLPQVAVNEVELQIAAGKLRVGTYGRGLWERPVYSTVSCSAPTNLSTSNVTVNSASLSWVINPSANNYDVDYKAASSGTWINAATATTSNSVNLTGLAGNTLYDWRVRSNCTGGSGSYTQAQFTTLTAPTCGTVTGLASSSITTTSATVSWSVLSGANNYDVDYKKSSDANWTNAISATTSLSLNLGSLSSGTLYDWRVRANCTGATGSYAQAQFTTVSIGCPDILEPNNTLATAAAIVTGNNYNALIATTTDKDYYSFSNTSANRRIKVTLTNLPANYNLSLYRSSGSLVASSSNTGTTSETIIYNASRSNQVGNYRVYVYGSSGAFNSTQCYTLLVQLSATNFTSANPPAEEMASQAYSETKVLKQGGIKLYPVPASGTVTVSFDAIAKGKAEIVIIDQLGATLLRKQTGVDIGINYQTLDIRKLPNGVYVVKVNKAGKVQTQKLIIQR